MVFRGLQAPVVVSPRSASSSWTTPLVPSSVTSRAQVCDFESTLRLESPKKNKGRHREDHIRGGNTRRHNEDPSQPYGEFCLSSATLHEPRVSSIANASLFAPQQSRLTTFSACSSPSVRPAVSVKIPQNENSFAPCLSSLFVSRISLTSGFL